MIKPPEKSGTLRPRAAKMEKKWGNLKSQKYSARQELSMDIKIIQNGARMKKIQAGQVWWIYVSISP